MKQRCISSPVVSRHRALFPSSVVSRKPTISLKFVALFADWTHVLPLTIAVAAPTRSRSEEFCPARPRAFLLSPTEHWEGQQVVLWHSAILVLRKRQATSSAV